MKSTDEKPTTSERAKRAEQQLAVTQRITHIGSWEWDVRSNRVTWSDELYRVYGLEPQSIEITYELFLSKLHPEDRERVSGAVRKALETGSRFAYPERIFRPDGSMRELDTVGDVLRDDDGRVIGLVGTCRDVTDERKRDETIRLYADIVHNMQIGLSVWTVGDSEHASTIRLAACNPAADRIARTELAPYVGKPLADIAPYAAGGKVEAMLVAVARDRQVREAVIERSRDPAHPNRALAAKAFPLPGANVGLALEDVTAQIVARRLKDQEQAVLEMIARGAPLAEVLTKLALVVEDHLPPTLASILLLDEDGRTVRDGAGPSLPEAYRKAIDGAPIGPRAGSCGTAAFRKETVIVGDIETDPLWDDYRELARAHGLRASWSTPIFATHGEVLGTFALYYREPRAPTPDDTELIARATHIAGIAIEHHRLADELRQLSARAESVREDERAGIAREIHDELGQSLTALKMDVAWIGRRCMAGNLSPGELKAKLDAMSQMIDGVIGEVRRISAELRPGMLDDLGLEAAIEWCAEETEKRTGIVFDVESSLGDAHLDRDLSTAVYRIFQEALTNVVRHASATHVDVRLEREAGRMRMSVQDDGKGLAPEATRGRRAFGLLGMRERARRFGGTISISGAPGKGTLVVLDVPIGAVAS